MVVKQKIRLYLIAAGMIASFSLLVLRLWSLQIDRHEEFVKKVRVGTEKRARIPGVRGEIKDRNGITLASNRAIFEVRINLGEMLTEFNNLVKQGVLVAPPEFTYEAPERGMMRQRSEPDVVEIFKSTIARRLADMGLARDFNANQMRIHYRTYKSVVPWVYRDDLTFTEFSRFAEHNLGLPGVTVTERAVRHYPFDSLACHLIGYVSPPDIDLVPKEEQSEWNYYLPDDYGVSGVEKSFDKYLQGKPGIRTIKIDERGRIAGEVSYQEPQKGNDVYITIDARIQYIAERALRDANIGRGSIVVVDPANGEVLAMASVPSYNPNKFIPSISTTDWNAYTTNPLRPLMNRAVSQYAPGSTYKIPISFAGCLAKIQSRSFNCAGGVQYGGKYMQCWIGQKGGSHGSLNLSDAIMRSCNCYFYQYGNTAGIDNITKVGKILGVGEKTGIELLDDKPGILPNPQWLQLEYPRERWSAGFTANTSIGQGFVLASPLQMASVTATVANGGESYRPHLLKRVTDGSEVIVNHEEPPRADLRALGITEAEVEMIRKGMWKVVNAPNGTARRAQIPGTEVAGKTGTAQFWRTEKKQRIRDNHTWFISFAPYQNPRFAVCVLVEGGFSGGGTAAPVATRVMEQALSLDQGFNLKPLPIAESEGSFKPITDVVYSGSAPQLLAVVEDEDLGPEREAPDEVPSAIPVARPSVRADADSAGSIGAPQNTKVPKAVPVRRAGVFNQESGKPPAPTPQPQEAPAKKRGLFNKLFNR
jgi:penicillin-binding protein 2